MATERFDILLNVRAAGAEEAAAKLRSLTSSVGSTRAGMEQLGNAGRAAMQMLSRETSNAGVAVKNLSNAWSASSKQGANMVTMLRDLERGYAQIARLNPMGGPTAWMAQFGRGQAQLVQQMRAVYNADPVRDLMAIQRQEQALAEAGASKRAAYASVRQAQMQAEMAGLSRLQVAEINLTRAKEQQARAVQAVQAAMRGEAQAGATLEARTAAAQRTARAYQDQARAIQEVTRAQRELASAQAAPPESGSSNSFLSSFSYFILSSMALNLAANIRDIGAASITASMEAERAFADVHRTFEGTTSQLSSLQGRLYELSTETPLTFLDLSEIAALGNQLGISAEDIEIFTTSISRFSAISGMSAEDASTAFGRISNLTGLAASNFENLASAITYTARTTVATEATITRTAQEIAALSAGAGLSAQAIVGLAGAMSSLAIPPERARGSLSLYFGALNSAVAEGGPKLEAFATLVGTTTEQLAQMVQNNQGEVVMTKFLEGLGDLNNVAKTTALDTLGLSTIRVDQSMRAMSAGVELVKSSLAGANQSFAEGSDQARQYAIIQDTLDSKWKEFQNSVQNLAAAFGDAFEPAIKASLEALTGFLVVARDLAKSPAGRILITIAGAAATLLAGLAALVGALALAKAGIVVLGFALSGMGWEKATTGLRAWIMQLIAAKTATDATTASTTANAVATNGLVGANGRLLVSTGANTASQLTFRAALAQTVLGLKTATVASNGFAVAAGRVGKAAVGFAVFGAVIGAAIMAIADIEKQINWSSRAIEGLGDGVDALADAMGADNADLFADRVTRSGEAADAGAGSVASLNDAVLAAANRQIEAANTVDGTTEALTRQEVQLGAATRAWLNAAVLQSEAVQKMISGEKSNIPVIGGLFDVRPMATELRGALEAGLDLEEFSEVVYLKGGDAGMAYYDGWIAKLQERAASGDAAAQKAIDAMGGVDIRNVLMQPLADGIDAAATEAIAKFALTGESIRAVAADYDEAGNYIGAAAGTAAEAFVVFEKVADRTGDLSKNLQKSLEDWVKIEESIGRAIELQNEANDTDIGIEELDLSYLTSAYQTVAAEGVTFWNGIKSLAAGGYDAFALQLSEMGPEAQGILSQALDLDSASMAELEEAARFAAFVGSEAFTQALNENLQDSNQTYAMILKSGGTLEDVKSLIAAEVAGVSDEWMVQWDANHPNLPISFRLSDLSPEEVETWKRQQEGKFQVEVEYKIKGDGLQGFQGIEGTGNQIITDLETGRQIILPATLDGEALTQALTVWDQNQDADPADIASKLNTETYGAELEAWKAANGPIVIPATVQVTNVIGIGSVAGKIFGEAPKKKDGGLITKDDFPAYAGGGKVYGSGSGTSDSVWARLSQGEFVNTKRSVDYWGADVFESLNRRMLPTRFAGMLAAAVSGNQGPRQVTNVKVVQNNPVTRDPLKDMREKSEQLMTGMWS